MTALVISFPQERIVRDRQAQIAMRKGFQFLRRRYPKKTPAEWWEGAACGIAIKAAWDQAAQEKESKRQHQEAGGDLLVELAANLMRARQDAADEVLARPGVRERFAAKLAELEAEELDQPPPSAA